MFSRIGYSLVGGVQREGFYTNTNITSILIESSINDNKNNPTARSAIEEQREGKVSPPYPNAPYHSLT